MIKKFLWRLLELEHMVALFTGCTIFEFLVGAFII